MSGPDFSQLRFILNPWFYGHACRLHSTVSAARLLRLRSAVVRPHDDVDTFLNLFIDIRRSSVLYVFALQ